MSPPYQADPPEALAKQADSLKAAAGNRNGSTASSGIVAAALVVHTVADAGGVDAALQHPHHPSQPGWLSVLLLLLQQPRPFAARRTLQETHQMAGEILFCLADALLVEIHSLMAPPQQEPLNPPPPILPDAVQWRDLRRCRMLPAPGSVSAAPADLKRQLARQQLAAVATLREQQE